MWCISSEGSLQQEDVPLRIVVDMFGMLGGNITYTYWTVDDR